MLLTLAVMRQEAAAAGPASLALGKAYFAPGGCLARGEQVSTLKECQSDWIGVVFAPYSVAATLVLPRGRILMTGVSDIYVPPDIEEALSSVRSLEFASADAPWTPWPRQGSLPVCDGRATHGESPSRLRHENLCVDQPYPALGPWVVSFRVPGASDCFRVRITLKDGSVIAWEAVAEGAGRLFGGGRWTLTAAVDAGVGTEALWAPRWDGGALAVGNLGGSGGVFVGYSTAIAAIDGRGENLTLPPSRWGITSVESRRRPPVDLPRNLLPAPYGFAYCLEHPGSSARRLTAVAGQGEVHRVAWMGHEAWEFREGTATKPVSCAGELYRTTDGQWLSISEAAGTSRPGGWQRRCLRNEPFREYSRSTPCPLTHSSCCDVPAFDIHATDGRAAEGGGALAGCAAAQCEEGDWACSQRCDARRRATERLLPCGSDARGRPLAVLGGARPALVRLDAALKVEHVLWSAAVPLNEGALPPGGRSVASWLEEPGELRCAEAGTGALLIRRSEVALVEGGTVALRWTAPGDEGSVRFAGLVAGGDALAIATNSKQFRFRRGGGSADTAPVGGASAAPPAIPLITAARPGSATEVTAFALEIGADGIATARIVIDGRSFTERFTVTDVEVGLALDGLEVSPATPFATDRLLLAQVNKNALRGGTVWTQRAEHTVSLVVLRQGTAPTGEGLEGLAAYAGRWTAGVWQGPHPDRAAGRMEQLLSEEGAGTAGRLALETIPGGGPDLQRWKALQLRSTGNPEAALTALGALTDRPARLLRARLLSDAGRWDEAISLWLALAEEKPASETAPRATLAEIPSGLGSAYLRRGLVELAIEALSEARRLAPDDPVHVSNLTAAYAALDKRNEALKQLFSGLGGSAANDPVLKFQLEQLSRKPSTAGSPPSGPVALTVLPFDTAGGLADQPELGVMVSSMATSAVAAAGLGPVMERARLQSLLREQELQQSARIDPATAVKLGRLGGARRLLVGNVARFETSLRIDARLVDVSSGEVVRAAGRSCAYDLEALQAALASLARELAAP